MEKEKTYCVYMHKNKINDKKYIGITSQKPKNRWQNGNGYNNKQPMFYNAILKYGFDNFEHIIIESNLTKKEAEKLEIELIKKFQTTNKNFGYNIESGGNAMKKLSEETKQKISNSKKGCTAWNKGKKLTDRQREKMSIIQQTEEYRNNISEKMSKKSNKKLINKNIYSEEMKQKHRDVHKLIMKPVIQYDLQNNFIREWQSVSQTIQDGHTFDGVSKCCKGIYQQHHGYIWRYRKDIENINI